MLTPMTGNDVAITHQWPVSDRSCVSRFESINACTVMRCEYARSVRSSVVSYGLSQRAANNCNQTARSMRTHAQRVRPRLCTRLRCVDVWELAHLSCCAQASHQGAPKDSSEADFRDSLHIISDERGHTEIRGMRVRS